MKKSLFYLLALTFLSVSGGYAPAQAQEENDESLLEEQVDPKPAAFDDFRQRRHPERRMRSRNNAFSDDRDGFNNGKDEEDPLREAEKLYDLLEEEATGEKPSRKEGDFKNRYEERRSERRMRSRDDMFSDNRDGFNNGNEEEDPLREAEKLYDLLEEETTGEKPSRKDESNFNNRRKERRPEHRMRNRRGRSASEGGNED